MNVGNNSVLLEPLTRYDSLKSTSYFSSHFNPYPPASMIFPDSSSPTSSEESKLFSPTMQHPKNTTTKEKDDVASFSFSIDDILKEKAKGISYSKQNPATVSAKMLNPASKTIVKRSRTKSKDAHKHTINYLPENSLRFGVSAILSSAPQPETGAHSAEHGDQQPKRDNDHSINLSSDSEGCLSNEEKEATNIATSQKLLHKPQLPSKTDFNAARKSAFRSPASMSETETTQKSAFSPAKLTSEASRIQTNPSITDSWQSQLFLTGMLPSSLEAKTSKSQNVQFPSETSALQMNTLLQQCYQNPTLLSAMMLAQQQQRLMMSPRFPSLPTAYDNPYTNIAEGIPSFLGMQPNCLAGLTTGKEFLDNKISFLPSSLNPSALASIASLSGRSIEGSEIRGGFENSSSESASGFLRGSVLSSPTLSQRLPNFNPFAAGMPMYMRRDLSSPSDSSNNGDGKVKKCRRSRTVFTELQLIGLEQKFEQKKYLSTPDRVELADTLGLSQLQVKTWYQNRRMKWKKQGQLNGSMPEAQLKPKGRPRKTPELVGNLGAQDSKISLNEAKNKIEEKEIETNETNTNELV